MKHTWRHLKEYLLEAPDRQTRPRMIVMVVLGDLSVFLAFVVLGKSEHGIIQGGAFVRTALPFAIVWLAMSPWLGAYRTSTLNNPMATAMRIPLIWLLCGVVALSVRALLTDRPMMLSFSLVAIGVQGILLLGWRGAFLTITRRFANP